MAEIQIKVPDIGGATDVDVIEVMVKPGDEVSKDTPLITLESDKASMEIPSPHAGKVKSLQVKVGDKVSEGDLILILAAEEVQESQVASTKVTKETGVEEKPNAEGPKKSTTAGSRRMEVCIPDIGGATDVDVIDIMVAAGQSIKKDQSIITLEGDKATMDIPSPAAGVVEAVSVKVGDKVSQGSLILTLNAEQDTAGDEVDSSAVKEEAQREQEQKAPKEKQTPVQVASTHTLPESTVGTNIPAGPAVRRMAREFGINLADVKGSGRKSRITKEDLQVYVKTRLSERPVAGGFALPAAPTVDFSKFGDIDVKPLNKIKRLTGANVHRSWITIPHVTQFDEADITELEAFRKTAGDNAALSGHKLTMLAFVTKVVSKALAVYPQFNASLDASGENLIYKKYFNIGIAVETPNGLVVPVIRNVDKLSVAEIAIEMGELSKKAREKGLMPADMSGGCFTISSLGGIGGTAFTPIVNSPEVAILGLSRSSIKPVYEHGEFKPRLMLPLSLSYDHRVIDGAEAARFSRFIAESLADIRRILL
ncbi:dihydrolipoyllysine-residue acetyltransferase [Legionella jamestowniensis]|uniref:Acetyltransferase component of pyruvate dehydrogenase complex n=1 Tax=Legionella jamestowniensis TaxID=455 RepID=A0A0W0UU43_9GAMM|nr:dihydrolipoyllysine-residue acetyltransferase [Legionella jamestowniensis]KTD11390.1 Pyruvate dehydrogenase (dihydrolipoyltransacetylase component) E2p [Legionella jamestowniensis]OCH98753.1 dihydrolipoyllysine-residue acetyltransferase [Legionella jamestowniensis]SFL68049.1 pyruvate dehydrogenase E2 component (dihydrolipoamide acetyltransferase) [Legionella jamestowniensis DSM 19215]